MVGQDVLVVGASSFVGRRLMARLGPRALGTYASCPAPGLVHFDATGSRLEALLAGRDFSHAVLLLGDTRPDSCFADCRRSQAVNVDGLRRVVDALLAAGVTPVFTSSEFVFDGERGGYRETDPAEPILLYGRQKLEVERYLQAHAPHAPIFRLAKIYGTTPGDGTLFSAWLQALQDGKRSFTVAADQRFSPVCLDDVVEILVRAVESGAQGLYHLAGPQAMSRLELFELLLGLLPDALREGVAVVPCSIRDFPLAEPRPLDVSLRVDKLVADFGCHLVTPEEGCRALLAAAGQVRP